MASRRQSKSARARKRAKARSRAAWRDELAEQLADHRIDALAIGLAVFGLLSLLAMFSDLLGPVGPAVGTGVRQVAQSLATGGRFVGRHARTMLTLPSEHGDDAAVAPMAAAPPGRAVLFDQLDEGPIVDLVAEAEVDEEDEYEEDEYEE